MISKEELVRSVAQSCGISPEISTFFFEVFVNRLSNHLKPGDLLHFQNFGYFHKRNCRIQLEKAPDSPTAKSYLIQLVLFSEETKIKNDLGAVQFLKIPNLKTLWLDDRDFQKSLNAGDFAPHIDRNQLIKSFATTAEVIIAGLRKDYDSELVEELIIPLTFDLNFLIKTGQKTSPSTNNVSHKSLNKVDAASEKKTGGSKNIDESGTPDKLRNIQNVEEPSEEGLPWNYGTKFLEKDKLGKSTGHNVNAKQSDIREKTIAAKQETDLRKDQTSRLEDFEPVTSHLSTNRDDIDPLEDNDTIKFSVSKANDDSSKKLKENKKFIEVKSKTESYRQKGDFVKTHKGIIDKYSSTQAIGGSQDKVYRERRSFLPFIALFSLVVIAGVVIYIYFIKDSAFSGGNTNIVYNVKPRSSVNVIERDYEFAVTYPYPKTENRIQVSGYNRDLFLLAEVKPEIKPEVKPESKSEEIAEVKDKPKEDKKNELPVIEKQTVTPEIKEDKISRIFLYKNFYVVHAGTFKSEEIANREADRYFDMGYNAFIEVVESRSGTMVYNLNVGDFTSEEFARQFQEKYIK